MKSSVIVFPGSNCDRDIAVALEKMHFENKMVWHKETLLRNKHLKFINKDINIKVMNNKTKFTSKYKINQILKINIAHNEGNYFTNSKHLAEIKKENLIAFQYCDEKGNINNDSNPNGSMENIAGIFNSKKNILGMMPHPERMVDKLISNTDGVNLFSSLLN